MAFQIPQLDERSKNYVIGIILAAIVVALASAGFGIWRLSKKSEEMEQKRVQQEELIKSVSAPAGTSKTTQEFTPEEKKVIDSLSTPTKTLPAIKKEILNSLNAPTTE